MPAPRDLRDGAPALRRVPAGRLQRRTGPHAEAFRLGGGGRVGTGRPFIPFVANRTVTRTLGRVLRRPTPVRMRRPEEAGRPFPPPDLDGVLRRVPGRFDGRG